MSNPTTITAPDGVPFVDIVREFDAPVSAVFRAYTDPELYAQWCGPHGYDMNITEFDVRDGGGWAFVHTNPAGDEFAFRGVFHSIVIDHRIVQTFEYAGAPGHVSLESATFEDIGAGRTRVTGHSVFQSIQARDGMVASGMDKGVNEGFDRLDKMLTN